MGLLNSAHECNRPSLLDFLFSDPPLPAAIVVVVVIVIVVFIKDPTYHLVRQNPASCGSSYAKSAQPERYSATPSDATMRRPATLTLH